MRIIIIGSIVIAAAITCTAQGIKYVTEAEIKEQIAATPCGKNTERLSAVKELFLKAGASEDDVKIEKIKDVENVVAVKKGKTAETIIIGAHYDKTHGGCGALDNWSGIVILANIYRTIRPLNTNKTYVFAAFGREEEGLIGSTAMANQIKKEDRSAYCAMVNFDTYGLAYPQVMTNISSSSLLKLAEGVSKEMNIPFAKASIQLASSDSAPFLDRDIPAISLHGLNGRWQEYLHTADDKVSNVNIGSVSVGYRHGVYFLAKLEASPCDAFRK
jgi:hypothetical protein